MHELLVWFEGWAGSPVLATLLLGSCIVLVSLLAGYIASRAAVLVTTRWLTPFQGERDERFDAQVARTRTPLWLLFSAIMGRNLLATLLPEARQAGFKHTLLVVSVIATGWLVLRLLSALEAVTTTHSELAAENNFDARRRHTQVRGFRNIAGFLTVVVTVAFVLLTFERVRQLGAGILASAGVAGVILGFAAQRSISTIVAGVQIAMTQPIRVGDVVIVEGEWGKIEEITLTYVVVAIWDLRRLVVPISYFIERPFQNWTRTSAKVLGTVELHVDYGVPVEAIRAKTKELLEASPYWDGDVFSVQVVGSDARSMVVRPLFSAKDSSDQWNLRCELREKLIAFLQENYPKSLPKMRAELDVEGTIPQPR